jgi:hypothetical protein
MSITNISKISITYDTPRGVDWCKDKNIALMDMVERRLKHYAILDIEFFGGCPAASPVINIEILLDSSIAYAIKREVVDAVIKNGFEVIR